MLNQQTIYLASKQYKKQIIEKKTLKKIKGKVQQKNDNISV